MIEAKNNHGLLRYFQHIQGSSFFSKINNVAISTAYKEPTLMNCPYVANPSVALSEKTHLLIEGKKGHGKTTLLKYLCYALSTSGDNTTKMHLGELIPFYFDINMTDVTIFSSYDSFVKSIVDLGIDCFPKLLENGQVLLLIDNIDCIPTGYNDKVFNVLDFINNNSSTMSIYTLSTFKRKKRMLEHCVMYNVQELMITRN